MLSIWNNLAMYTVKEIYYTIQGEGYHAGRPAVFCRFSGCNLWSGREEDRAKAICKFCDTDFWGTDGPGGGKYELDELVANIMDYFPAETISPFVVFTGGEPALQMDLQLIEALHFEGVTIAIETNGTKPLPDGIDWVCVSPKANTEIVVTSGDELKIVVPQKGIDPEEFAEFDFDHYYLQPMESKDWEDNIIYAINYCKNNPFWKLSVQTHKYLGIS